jgi:pyruvate-formate lyase-activating enzyme
VLIKIKVVDRHLHLHLIVAVEARALKMIKRARQLKFHQMVLVEIKNLVIKKLEEVQDQVHRLVQVQVNQGMAKRNLIITPLQI